MISKWCFIRCGTLRIIIWALIVSIAACPISNVFAQTQGECEARLKEAEQKIYDGFFDEAITILEQCLAEKDITHQEKAKTHELLAKAYLAKDYMGQAESAITKLLDLLPSYSPNPDRDSPPYVALVEKVKKEKEPKEETGEPWYNNTWVWIAGGAVVGGGVLIAVLAGGKDENKTLSPLPGPPGLP